MTVSIQNAKKHAGRRAARGFSMIELVIVIVIIGIIAAIAIPRMSRGSAAAADSAVKQNLAVLRGAIDLYHTEHNGVYPTAAAIVTQLTQYTDIDGNVSATKTGAYIYGPYLRQVPTITVGAQKGTNGISGTAGTGIAWVYTESTGTIAANASGNDSAGAAYSSY